MRFSESRDFATELSSGAINSRFWNQTRKPILQFSIRSRGQSEEAGKANLFGKNQ
jgi:hypothetical protein